jgi:hypothetical protein
MPNPLRRPPTVAMRRLLAAGYETPYAVYTYSRVQYYGNLISYYSC